MKIDTFERIGQLYVALFTSIKKDRWWELVLGFPIYIFLIFMTSLLALMMMVQSGLVYLILIITQPHVWRKK